MCTVKIKTTTKQVKTRKKFSLIDKQRTSQKKWEWGGSARLYFSGYAFLDSRSVEWMSERVSEWERERDENVNFLF